MERTWISRNEDDTADIAAEIAHALPSSSMIIGLYGDVGAGKTSLCRALIRVLCNDSTMIVPSPTYTLVQTYDEDQIWHFDLYRLDHVDQLYDIGWEDALSARLCLIEWPERLGGLAPPNMTKIHIVTLADETRQVSIAGS